MATKFTAADVNAIAVLAKLELTDEENTLFTRQIAEILAYAEELQALDTTGVPATAHVQPEANVDRADNTHESLAPTEALANAPDPALKAGLFRVPRVIGG
jgi:aspartyl-tRNA(Asn)/glutamyl-tRNA(Gln) amidotransferase subunit C